MKLNLTTTTMAALFVWTTAHAATVSVTNTNDGGAGSLRAALATATNGDVINATAVTGSIKLATGQLVVSNSVTILGPGPGSLAVDGSSLTRLFYITNAVNAVIAGVNLTNGRSSGNFPGGYGGAIWNDHSTLMLSNCVVNSSTAQLGRGGGIYNDGISGHVMLSIIASTISSNNAGSSGGGIFNDASGGTATVWVSASSIVRNVTGSAGSLGGGIFNDGGSGSATLVISNSTLSDNSVALNGGKGGGIFNANGMLTLITSTLHSNSSPNFSGGNIWNEGAGARLEIGSTILTTFITFGNILNSAGSVVSHGYNLSSDNGGGVLTNATDQINTNPLLGPLANNGGPTPTHSPLPGSPAIDKGISFGLTTDQRGLPRPADDLCIANAAGGDGSDIGAVETQDVCVNLQITGIAREANDIRITWTTYAGKSNFVERTAGVAGSFTNNFTGITNIVTTGTVTNYLDIGAATNVPAFYYRVRLVP